jgi:ParB/RepB/Spo0J family partition protein
VLEVKEISLSSLKPWDDNPRKNDHAVEAVAESVHTYGFNVPIICDQNLMIVAGHTRWKAAQKLGLVKVPVIIIEMDDVKRRAFAIADNKTGEIAQWDFPKLKELLETLKQEDVDIKSLGFSSEEITEILDPTATLFRLNSLLSQGYVDGMHEIDTLKLAYRLESISYCDDRKLAIDLFSGKGQLAFWYKRIFSNVIRVDKEEYDGIEYHEKADSFLRNHLDRYQDFNFIDFDDEGCPGKELQLFFSLIVGKREPFILCLTDGMGLHFKLRGKTNLYYYYLFGKNETTIISSNLQYSSFDLYVRHLVDTLCNKHGFENQVISWYRGAEGSVIYACFRITPKLGN